ncbi:MAG: cytidylate kinase-like family protein [Muribaculaceae bacterium]|jgi:cytidylate kinase|nr:cytidylate kinase-like family protein [Muribaculaceae bacterium]MBQ2370801.1 cytidylate kinase-like family protein [Muribaculaceae bacterium]MBQ2398528.1 cytidylate kinase-like family protein [Muribaculaceae bacterium]MBQ2440115.1 cytidylate kinase-like family protein [Muribaculaceae bacterium]MBQ5722940.1 cytidylate kinase-like family protein [Muribaculaceae bacterium]
MEKKLTTIIIGRQFGAGGRELGELLAKKLGIPYYDRSLLKVAAQRLGFDEEIFDNADERKPSILRSMLSINYGAMAADYSISSLNREKIYMAQSDVIRQLAQEGPAVFVGRTADYITRDMPHRLSIFLHADIESRAERVLRRCECSCICDAREFALKRDKMRQDYYNYFTGRNWGDAANYDLTFDTSRISIEKIADIIIQLI